MSEYEQDIIVRIAYSVWYDEEVEKWYLSTDTSPYMLLEAKTSKKLFKKFDRAIDFLNEVSEHNLYCK